MWAFYMIKCHRYCLHNSKYPCLCHKARLSDPYNIANLRHAILWIYVRYLMRVTYLMRSCSHCSNGDNVWGKYSQMQKPCYKWICLYVMSFVYSQCRLYSTSTIFRSIDTVQCESDKVMDAIMSQAEPIYMGIDGCISVTLIALKNMVVSQICLKGTDKDYSF